MKTYQVVWTQSHRAIEEMAEELLFLIGKQIKKPVYIDGLRY